MKRAARRKDFAKLVRTEGGDILDDVSAAEAEYEAHQGFWDNSGIPIEPFHLRQEREAGFFDDEGNYVAFRDEVEDAWLESLPKGAHLCPPHMDACLPACPTSTSPFISRHLLSCNT